MTLDVPRKAARRAQVLFADTGARKATKVSRCASDARAITISASVVVDDLLLGKRARAEDLSSTP